MRIRSIVCLAIAALLTTAAQAQLLSVPQRGVAGPWVKTLKIAMEQDWEWVETYEDRVYFATRADARREGDMVTMWTRVEFRDPQGTAKAPHRSVASQDLWDCKEKRRGTAVVLQYRYNNLEDSTPFQATNPLISWEKVAPETIGEALLEFACGIAPTQQLVPAAKPAAPTKPVPQR